MIQTTTKVATITIVLPFCMLALGKTGEGGSSCQPLPRLTNATWVCDLCIIFGCLIGKTREAVLYVATIFIDGLGMGTIQLIIHLSCRLLFFWLSVINTRRMHKGYGSYSMSVCLLLRYRLHPLFISLEDGVKGSLWRFNCVDLPENALFSSYGIIYVELLPSTLPGEFSMERMNISGLFSTYKACGFSDSSTNSSLVIVGYQLRFLALHRNRSIC
jgi:hypothetical protein